MPDAWESANGSNSTADDAMKKAADGYDAPRALHELAGGAARADAAAPRPPSISAAYTAGFANVSPNYAVSGAQNGTVTLAADKHTAQFQPTAGFHGMGSFAFTVSGSDGTAYSSQVSVLVTP